MTPTTCESRSSRRRTTHWSSGRARTAPAPRISTSKTSARPARRWSGCWLAERGVDLVHGHSPHVSQGVEVNEETPICYDCGDFVDDYAVDSDLRNDRSFLFEVSVAADGEIRELRLSPTGIDDCAVHEAGRRAAEWSRSRMRELPATFGTEFEEEDGELELRL
jgi:poly-gamma-glutamate synthesis protein (capsule biosynthesis protein)